MEVAEMRWNQCFITGKFPGMGWGLKVETSLDSAAALKIAGLDWEVIRRPVQVDGNIIEDYFANIRVSDNQALGIVGKDYKIVQNREANCELQSCMTLSQRNQINNTSRITE